MSAFHSSAVTGRPEPLQPHAATAAAIASARAATCCRRASITLTKSVPDVFGND
jgi:hypothetical protein